MTFTEQKKILSKGGLLYLILDFEVIKKLRKDIFLLLDGLASSGVDMVQFRFKNLSNCEALTIARKITSMLKRKHVITVINDRCDIAFLSHADGVHLGAEDLSTKDARKILGKNKLVGRTIHSYKDMKLFGKEADYLSIGPVFPTTTKDNLKATGIKKFCKLYSLCNKPIFAIGGINIKNIFKLTNKGINNVAICSGILASPQPKETTRLIKQCLQKPL